MICGVADEANLINCEDVVEVVCRRYGAKDFVLITYIVLYYLTLNNNIIIFNFLFYFISSRKIKK